MMLTNADIIPIWDAMTLIVKQSRPSARAIVFLKCLTACANHAIIKAQKKERYNDENFNYCLTYYWSVHLGN